jgi:hypothetical protein
MTTLIPQYDQGATGAVNRPINLKLAESVSVLDFGAVGNGTADDTASIQAALNSGNSIYFPQGYTFGISSELTLSTNNVALYGGGTIAFLSSYNTASNTLLSAITITGSGVIIDGINFNGSAISTASITNRFVWFKAANCRVTNKCSFVSLVGGGANFNGAVEANASASALVVEGAYFNNCPGSVFVQSPNCVISNNTVYNPHDVCFALNGPSAVDCIITGNTINNSNLNSAGGLITAEESASQWVISNNTILGVANGIGIGALNVAVTTNVRGGVITGNIINAGAGTTTNPVTLIYTSPYYLDTIISENILIGLPTGASGSAYISVCATGVQVINNTVNGQSATQPAMLINAGATGLTVKDNVFTMNGSVRHVLFNAGSYTGLPVAFIGGKYYSGGEGINTALNSPTGLTIYIVNITDSTASNFLNVTQLGDINTYFDTYHAINLPHSIKTNTVMYGNAAPTSSAKAYALADTIYNIAPAVGSPKGWVCTVAGSPGTWVSMGNL